MAFSAPTLLKSMATNSAGQSTLGGSGSKVIANAAIGDLVIVTTAYGLGSTPTLACTDSKGNTYTAYARADKTSASTSHSAVFYSVLTSALVSGTDFLTITYGTAATEPVAHVYKTTPTAGKTISADGQTGATGSSTSPASGTVTTTGTDEILFAAVSSNAPSTFTNGSGWSAPATTDHTANTDIRLDSQYRIESSTGTINGDGTFSPTTNWASSIAAFKATSTAPANTVAPAVTGTATVGSVLTTTNGTWTDAGSPAFTYQWQRGGVNIGSATSSTYTLVDADDATNVRCVVTDTDANGATAANSNAVAILEPVPANTVLPAVTGTTALGDTLTCSTGTWSHQGGTVATYAYQWQRDDVNIASATAATRVIASADQGHNLRCTVTATNSGGAGSPVNSAETAVPAAGAASDTAQKSGSAAPFLLILGSN